MKLNELLKGIEIIDIKGEINKDINELNYDSRKVKKDDVFFCITGFNVDGHDYVESAVKNGATVIFCEKPINIDKNITIIRVEDTRKVLAICSSNYYDKPAEKMKVIGITGTNGKTTVSYMTKSILESSGYKVGIIGTIANYIGDKKLESHRTTPESLELHGLFRKMVDENVDYCVMEISSHSLALDRVYGIEFENGAFTNLTQDHLDFHKNFENYFNAKLKLFKNSKKSILNIDDNYGREITQLIDTEIRTYGIENESDLRASNIHMSSNKINFDLDLKDSTHKIEVNIPGRYNIYNALASIGICLNEGISIESIIAGLNNVSVPGRCEIVTKSYNLGFDVIIDYAHTPDGLKNILSTVKEITNGRLISVFGCGGDRDKTKRPIMGSIGSEISDLCIITSDNPRSEEPMKIIEDVVEGIKTDNYIIVENRKQAIKKALTIADKGDIVIIAGKGHEDYQILKDETIHFDEREIVEELIKELF